MRKVPSELENPFDDFILRIVEKTVDYYKNEGFTPNIITFWGFIIRIIALYVLYNANNVVICSVLFIIGYYFDCLDGYMARKFNMTSKFGKLFDKWSDLFIILLIMILIYTKYRNKFKLWMFMGFVIIIIVNIIYGGWQIDYINEKLNDKHILVRNPNYIKYYSYIGGSGSVVLFLIIVLYFLVR